MLQNAEVDPAFVCICLHLSALLHFVCGEDGSTVLCHLSVELLRNISPPARQNPRNAKCRQIQTNAVSTSAPGGPSKMPSSDTSSPSSEISHTRARVSARMSAPRLRANVYRSGERGFRLLVGIRRRRAFVLIFFVRIVIVRRLRTRLHERRYCGDGGGHVLRDSICRGVQRSAVSTARIVHATLRPRARSAPPWPRRRI